MGDKIQADTEISVVGVRPRTPIKNDAAQRSVTLWSTNIDPLARRRYIRTVAAIMAFSSPPAFILHSPAGTLLRAKKRLLTVHFF